MNPPAPEVAPRGLSRWLLVPMSPRWLAGVRIVTVVVVLLMLWQPQDRNLLATARNLDRIPHGMWSPLTFSWPLFQLLGAPSNALLDGLRVLVTIAGVVTALGLFTTASSMVFGISYLVYVACGVSFGHVYSLGTPLYLLLLFGPAMRWGAAWSIDALRAPGDALRAPGAEPGPDVRYGASLRIIHAMTGMLFFFAAVTKVWNCGGEWFGGGVLARYITYFNFLPHLDPNYVLWKGQDHLPWLANVIIERPPVEKLLELLTLGFEATFFLTFFWSQLIPLYLFGAILFHVSITLAIPPVVGITWLPCYVAVVASVGRRVPVSIPGARLVRRDWALFTALVLIEALVCVIGLGRTTPLRDRVRRIVWPYSPQVMFAWPLPPSGMTRTQFRYEDAAGHDLGAVTIPEVIGSRITAVSFDNPSSDPSLAELATVHRCEVGPKEATSLRAVGMSWRFEDVYASYQHGSFDPKVSRKPMRKIALGPCP